MKMRLWLTACTLFLLALITLGVSSCVLDHSNPSKYTSSGVSERCLNGVVYYDAVRHWETYAMTPAFKQDGSLHLC